MRDTGRGIEAERLGTIFDRFSSFSEKGSGLGLALGRRLVEQLGGQIAVESRLGHGTTFRFTIPVAAVAGTSSPRGGWLMAEIKLERKAEAAKLRVYIGAAPGVGKTYHMLNDAYMMKHQMGIDVVIGLVESHGRKDTEARVRDLEIVPQREIPYQRRHAERDGCGLHPLPPSAYGGGG